MSITRIFRVRIVPNSHAAFEAGFSSISVRAVNEALGLLAVSIFRPTKWAPDEYAMITRWESEAVLKAFAGEQWNQGVIPPGMEQFVVECWVHHYESWDET